MISSCSVWEKNTQTPPAPSWANISDTSLKHQAWAVKDQNQNIEAIITYANTLEWDFGLKSNLSKKTFDFVTDQSAEWSEISVFTESNKDLVSILITYFWETGKKEEHIYIGDYEGKELITLIARTYHYNMEKFIKDGEMETSQTEEKSYYFYDGTLIQWEKDGKIQTIETDLKQQQEKYLQEILQEAKQHIKSEKI